MSGEFITFHNCFVLLYQYNYGDSGLTLVHRTCNKEEDIAVRLGGRGSTRIGPPGLPRM